jgi:hypothetical protein
MKKVLAGAVVLAAAVLAFSLANAQFGSIKVPGVGSVSADVKTIEHDQCTAYVDKYRDNVEYNSTNMKGILDSNKDCRHIKTSKDWKISNSKYDKENKIWEAEYQFKNTQRIRVGCSNEKCSTLYCSNM